MKQTALCAGQGVFAVHDMCNKFGVGNADRTDKQDLANSPKRMQGLKDLLTSSIMRNPPLTIP